MHTNKLLNSGRNPAMDWVAQKAREAAHQTMPLDNADVRRWAREFARQYADTTYEQSLYETLFFNAYLQELRLVMAERLSNR